MAEAYTHKTRTHPLQSQCRMAGQNLAHADHVQDHSLQVWRHALQSAVEDTEMSNSVSMALASSAVLLSCEDEESCPSPSFGEPSRCRHRLPLPGIMVRPLCMKRSLFWSSIRSHSSCAPVAFPDVRHMSQFVLPCFRHRIHPAMKAVHFHDSRACDEKTFCGILHPHISAVPSSATSYAIMGPSSTTSHLSSNILTFWRLLRVL